MRASWLLLCLFSCAWGLGVAPLPLRNVALPARALTTFTPPPLQMDPAHGLAMGYAGGYMALLISRIMRHLASKSDKRV
jgi:hypothetical protein